MECARVYIRWLWSGTIESRPVFSRKISNQARFWLDGFVNKQNWRIWSKWNPMGISNLYLILHYNTWSGIWLLLIIATDEIYYKYR